MPIYEYRCNDCGKEFSVLVLNSKESAKVECGACGSDDLSRLISQFSFHQTEASRIDRMDTEKSQDESFYKDNRNIGLWAKKRAKQLGIDLGRRFDETVDKARSGKFIEEFEK